MQQVLERHYRLVLIAILFFAFITRIYRVDLPKKYVFDEVYHAVTAKLINQNDLRAYEWWNPPPEPDTAVDWLHPPLAKYTQALGMKIFGENSFGWRISSVVFGVFVILVTYLLAYELFQHRALSLLAAGLASLDGLLLVQSRVAMNDIHVTFFILLTLLLYVRYRKKVATLLIMKVQPRFAWTKVWLAVIAVALSAGLALGSKWSGAFVVMIVLISEGALWLKRYWPYTYLPPHRAQVPWPVTIGSLVILSLLPVVIYVGAYTHMFAQGKSLWCNQKQAVLGTCYQEEIKVGETLIYRGYLSHFLELHRQIWWYQTNLKATHPYQSRPWQWFLDLRPVWYFVEYPQDHVIRNIYAFGNPALFWLGDVAVVASGIWLLWQIIRRRQLTPQFWAMLFTLFSYVCVWALWQLSPRIMFFYHYTPAVPLLSVLLSFWLVKIWSAKRATRLARLLVVISLLCIVACFGLWYSHWTGLPVSIELRDRVFFLLPSWR